MDKILVIQDSPSINMMLKYRLEGAGFFVDTAETGLDGLAKAKAGEYQLILLDYNLPDSTGDDICRALRKEKNTENVSIVFVSATEGCKMADIARSSGADGCIEMPFKGEEVINSLKKFIASRK